MLKVCVIGIGGRMGGEVAKFLNENGQKWDIILTCGVERKDSEYVGKKLYRVDVFPDIEECFDNADIFVEFTTPEATKYHIGKLLDKPKKYICGTTGLDRDTFDKMEKLSEKTAVFYSPNMSIGVNLLFKIVEFVCTFLKDKDYDVEIVEMHHRFKRDAPSGTALKIFEIIKGIYGDLRPVYGREGKHLRNKKDVGIFALRGGDVVGEHRVIFSTLGERIELVHIAHSRKAFASGVLEAIKFVKNRSRGFFTTMDILG